MLHCRLSSTDESDIGSPSPCERQRACISGLVLESNCQQVTWCIWCRLLGHTCPPSRCHGASGPSRSTRSELRTQEHIICWCQQGFVEPRRSRQTRTVLSATIQFGHQWTEATFREQHQSLDPSSAHRVYHLHLSRICPRPLPDCEESPSKRFQAARPTRSCL